MDNVTLENGIAKGGDSNQGGGGLGAGGAIFNQGALNLTDVTFANNEALGGSSNIASAGNGGGGMGQNSPFGNSNGGGFGGSAFSTAGGGGKGNTGGGGGGDNFMGASTPGGDATDLFPGVSGGFSGFGGGYGGQGGGTGNAINSGDGGFTGKGGLASGTNGGDTGGGGGGGVGGGGEGADGGGYGGFGGGGGFGFDIGGGGGFGAGAGGKNVSGGDDTRGGLFAGDSSGAFGGGGAGMGGAIFNMGADSAHPGSGMVTCVNCTFTENSAQGGSAAPQGNGGVGVGGAIFNFDGTVTLTNDTLVGNAVHPATTAARGALAGAIFNAAYGSDIDTGNPVTATLVLNNCIVALNNDDNGNDLSSLAFGTGTNTATVSGSHNLITSFDADLPSSLVVSTADPKLGPLQNNGGLVPTLLPQSGSPVLGTGDPSLAPTTDQRGQPRPANGPIDLGAVQVSAAPPAGGSTGGSGGSTPSPTPPELHKPFLLELFDDFLKGVETVNANRTETVTDNLFGFPLVSTYDGAGYLERVTLLGFDITVLFE